MTNDAEPAYGSSTGGYAVLLKRSFFPTIKRLEEAGELPKGILAVVYDKNPMEASGYANQI